MKTSVAYKVTTFRINVTDGPRLKTRYSFPRIFNAQHVEITIRESGTEVTVGGPSTTGKLYMHNSYTEREVAAGEMPLWIVKLVKESQEV